MDIVEVKVKTSKQLLYFAFTKTFKIRCDWIGVCVILILMV